MKVLFIFLSVLTISSCLEQSQQNFNSVEAQEQSTISKKTIPKIQIPSNQINLQNSKSEIPYTQSIEQFKKSKYSQRLQLVAGCWLLSRDYLKEKQSQDSFFINQLLRDIISLKMVKQCLKKISRKDAVLKITQLVGKNMAPSKKYQQIIPKSKIDQIFIKVNNDNIENYQAFSTEQSILPLDVNKLEREQLSQNQTNIQNLSESDSNVEDLKQPKLKLQNLSQFDQFLSEKLKKYQEQFEKLISSKQGIQGKVEQELKKRQKFYFGFIPANQFSHTIFLISLSLSMLFCCTCYKYYKIRSAEKESISNKGEQSYPSREVRKMTKMSQMTFKKKSK